MATDANSQSKGFVKKYHHYITPGIDLTAGTLGGAACVFAGQPLDTVKVKMQTFPNLYNNAFQCVKETLLKEKFYGLYSGTVPALIANCSENAILFCAYGVCQNAVKLLVKKKSIKDLNSIENAFAGCFAAFFSSFTLCPTELIKCRLQAMREASSGKVFHKGPWRLTKEIIKKEGITTLYRGLGVTMVREMVGYFFFFGAYDVVRTFFTPKGKSKDDIGLLKTTIAGGCGGISFWIAIFPADLIKSRIQIMNASKSSLLLTKEIVQKDGLRVLYKGLGPTLVRTFPATGALFVVYEYSKRFLHYMLDCPV